MNVLSLFDGMSCGMLALKKSGVNVSYYYASEIDRNAISVSKLRHPEITHIGDVSMWMDWDIDWRSIDLLIGGSPCQGFSMAGKGKAFRDERSKLFFTYLDILDHIRSKNPNVKFMLENVKMKDDHSMVITNSLGVNPNTINSSLVSAQNRERMYWFNWDADPIQDMGVVLSDVCEIVAPSRSPDWIYIDCKETKSGLKKLAYYGNGSQGQRLYCSSGKHPCLNANASGGPVLPFIMHEGRIGKLDTNSMCRLQNVPEGYFDGFSHTVAAKCLGNGWTVDVVSHIFNGMNA